MSENRRKFKPFRGTGDSGISQLFNGEKRSKSDAVFEALGSADELNSQLGCCRVYAQNEGLFEMESTLKLVQCCLQDLASAIATPATSSSSAKLARVEFDANLADKMDDYIDKYDEPLPKLKTFILPGGNLLSANLHIARSVCRRAERSIVRLNTIDENEEIPKSGLKFLNRTSDLLFVLARYSIWSANLEEDSYVKPK